MFPIRASMRPAGGSPRPQEGPLSFQGLGGPLAGMQRRQNCNIYFLTGPTRTAHEWRALAQERGLRGLRILLRYVASAAPGEGFAALRRILASCEGRAKEEIMTAADRFRREGFKLGIEKGIEKGIDQGKAALLLKQLRLRFGELPADVATRVSQASTAELETWAERVLTAPDLQSCLSAT